jgi:hypothetical protein
MQRFRVTDSLTRRWHEEYGIDLSPMVEVGGQSLSRFAVRAHRASGWRLLSEPAVILAVDLTSDAPADLAVRKSLPIVREGSGAAVIAGMTAELGGGRSLSSWPDAGDPTCHWGTIVTPFDRPRRLHVGGAVAIHLYHRGQTRVSVESIEPAPPAT